MKHVAALVSVLIFSATVAAENSEMVFQGPEKATKEELEGAAAALQARIRVWSEEHKVELAQDGDKPCVRVTVRGKMADSDRRSIAFLASMPGKRIEMFAVLERDPKDAKKFHPGPWAEPEKDLAPPGGLWLRQQHIAVDDYTSDIYSETDEAAEFCTLVRKEPLATAREFHKFGRTENAGEEWGFIEFEPLAIDRMRNAANPKNKGKYSGMILVVDGKAIPEMFAEMDGWYEQLKGRMDRAQLLCDPAISDALKALVEHPLPVELRVLEGGAPEAKQPDPQRADPAKPTAKPSNRPLSKPPPETAPVIARINEFRKAAGLAPVGFDAELSAACVAHARYLVIHDAEIWSGDPLQAHSEKEGAKGFTTEGKQAAESSVIAWQDPLPAVDAWMAELFHRAPFFDPRLKSVAVGKANGTKYGSVSLVNVEGGVDQEAKWDPGEVVVYPADKQKGVPLTLANEIPCPIPDDVDKIGGYPITAHFSPDAKVTDAKATLKVQGGGQVPFWFSTPENPADVRYQRNTVCLIAKDALTPSTVYWITMEAVVNGEPWKKSWAFATGEK